MSKRGSSTTSTTSTPQVATSAKPRVLGATIRSALTPITTNTSQAFLLKVLILGLIYVLAFVLRLFSVARYESIIHEFDPWFNFRTTKYMVENSFLDFMNWFDDRAWYPLGRHIGGTIYPGLMATAAFVHYIANSLNITINIRNICVMLGPFFASNTSIVAYLMSKEIHDEGTGLVSAALIALVPGYISRSVAGSYDNEAVAIFALLLTFYLWVKAVKTGSLVWSVACAIAYFYMVAAWGGYIYITNLLPLYTLTLLIFGRYSNRLYIAYSVVYVLGTLLSMQVMIVEFKPVRTSEHFAALGVFLLIQIYGIFGWARGRFTTQEYIKFRRLLILAIIGAAAVVFAVSGQAISISGRLLSILTTKSSLAIISSVAEHQPAVWDSLFFDMQMLVFLIPVGIYFCFRDLSDGGIFLVFYGLSSLYFAGVMVRLILVVSPVACLLGGIAVSHVLRNHMLLIKKQESKLDIGLLVAGGVTLMLFMYGSHSIYVASEAYSSPSIVLSARGPGNTKIIFDDFREAYRWLNQNTADDAVVMSWWDYGYQISGMAERTVLVDGNTRNNTHIARVGRAFASGEDKAARILRELDVDYVLVIFGGMVGYASDDINKFLWMVRIGGGTFPEIKESDYLGDGVYRVDRQASKTMTNSLMYKLCYYRFGELQLEHSRPPGFDRVRNVEIGSKNFKLKHFEEVYTTEHWLVRLYRLKGPKNTR